MTLKFYSSHTARGEIADRLDAVRPAKAEGILFSIRLISRKGAVHGRGGHGGIAWPAA
jgi:hypothetical protein